MPNDADRAGTPAGVFGAELRFYRTRAGLSQKDLAALVHVSNERLATLPGVLRLSSTLVMKSVVDASHLPL